MASFHPESTLQDLSLHEFQVEDSCPGQTIYKVLEEQPELPGVILLNQGKLVGMISRQRFWERLSRAYGRELFLRRSIAVLYEFVSIDPLVLPGTTLITEAARYAVERPMELLNDPVVVEVAPQTYRLLDVHDLLITQAAIHQLTSQLLQQKTQAEIMHTEKLASLGKLLAGMAHEIRNPVNFIGGNLHYLENYCRDLIRLIKHYKTELATPSEAMMRLETEIDLDFVLTDLFKVLESVSIGTDRLQSLVNSLQSFSRMDEREQSEADIHQSLEGTLLILSNRLKRGIQVIKEYGDLPRLKCYPGPLSQVFMNILSNAIDALMEHEAQLSQAVEVGSSTQDNAVAVANRPWEPEITIRTSLASGVLAESLTRGIGEAPSQESGDHGYLSICIQNNGPSIPAHLQKRIFEEFFTTKPVGQGTGLGLSIAAQIVQEQHKGHLLLRSPCFAPASGESPYGVEFEILLPII
jgi:two-component system, NtrC family, sensor kinase